MKINFNFLKKENLPANRQGGAAMLISVVFFIFISLAIVSGLVSPTVRDFKNSTVNLNSKKSYFLSESGIEDATYRIVKNKTIGSSETITLDSNTVTTTITSVSGSIKQISSEIISGGNAPIYNRKNSATLTSSAGTSFNYGVQVGQGGVYLSSGTINGNVYANGPIMVDDSNNNAITGTAISANSPALTSDQSNGAGTPAYNIVFGNANSAQDIAQSFQVSTDQNPFNKIRLYIKKVGSPSDATIKIVNDSNGLPGNTVFATGTLLASSVTISYGWLDITFDSNPLLDINTTYWITVNASSSSSKYYTIGASNGGYPNGLGKIGQVGGTWNSTTPSGLDYFFSIYLGGVNGSIIGDNVNNQLHIGTVSGTAQAHTVNYVTATGNIYCVFGTGNNKSCTSQADPTYIAYPISDANITQWQADALAGGISNGNYSVGGAGATLGPKKIVGDLSVSDSGVLTVSGTLWVTGNINLSGNGTIQLASSYGTNDGVLVVDGTVSVSGGGHATGSGIAGSYIMMLTNDSSENAVKIVGGAGAVIVYAPNGTIEIGGGASLKEATGYKVKIEGRSSITYESGLANSNFSSGPSGSWTVGGWGETQ